MKEQEARLIQKRICDALNANKIIDATVVDKDSIRIYRLTTTDARYVAIGIPYGETEYEISRISGEDLTGKTIYLTIVDGDCMDTVYRKENGYEYFVTYEDKIIYQTFNELSKRVEEEAA